MQCARDVRRARGRWAPDWRLLSSRVSASLTSAPLLSLDSSLYLRLYRLLHSVVSSHTPFYKMIKEDVFWRVLYYTIRNTVYHCTVYYAWWAYTTAPGHIMLAPASSRRFASIPAHVGSLVASVSGGEVHAIKYARWAPSRGGHPSNGTWGKIRSCSYAWGTVRLLLRPYFRREPLVSLCESAAVGLR